MATLIADADGNILPLSGHSASYLKKQAMWAAIGLLLMIVFSRLSYSRLQKAAVWLLLAALALLIPLAVMGALRWLRAHHVPVPCPRISLFPYVNGSYRWIRLGPASLQLSIQPSEFAKLALTVFTAAFLAKRASRIAEFGRCLLPSMVIVGAAAGMVFMEPDFGAAAVIAAIVFSIWYVAGVRGRYLWTMVILGAPTFIWLMLAEKYRRMRWLAFLDPEKYLLQGGWQPFQSLVALGSGGWQGLGLGQSRQKYQFLGEPHTDFIFAIVGEETGLIGTLGLIVLYAILITVGLIIARQTFQYDFFGALAAYGLTAMIAIPTIINLAVVTSSMPTKGLALPFLSYGGSSMIANCIAVGILMNIASQNHAQKIGRASCSERV